MSQSATRQCAWCRRTWDEDKQRWVSTKKSLKGKEVTHGICDPCGEKLEGTIPEAPAGNPVPKKTNTLELVKVLGFQIMSGKKVEMIFLVNRRRNQRLVDPILRDFDLAGIHITSVNKMRTRKKTIMVSTNVLG